MVRGGVTSQELAGGGESEIHGRGWYYMGGGFVAEWEPKSVEVFML